MGIEAVTTFERRSIGGVDVELARHGRPGKQLLLLHSEDGIEGASGILPLLAETFEVYCPSHPGFGGSSLPHHISSVDDLAHYYLDLVEALDLNDAVLVGAGIGAWIAAEIATKSTQRFTHLVLAAAVGVKFSDRESSDFADIFSLSPDEVSRRSYRNPASADARSKNADADVLKRIARNREATTLFGWSPYMHNPKLRQRLHRIDIPTLLLWGESDGISPPAYGRKYAETLPDARFELIAGAAHYPLEEQPQHSCETIARFVKG